MKINESTANAVSTSRLGSAQATGSVGRNGRGSSTESGTGDHVQLSNLASVVRSLATDGPERAARVDQLAFQVQSGRYNVNSAELSSNIVNAALRGF